MTSRLSISKSAIHFVNRTVLSRCTQLQHLRSIHTLYTTSQTRTGPDLTATAPTPSNVLVKNRSSIIRELSDEINSREYTMSEYVVDRTNSGEFLNASRDNGNNDNDSDNDKLVEPTTNLGEFADAITKLCKTKGGSGSDNIEKRKAAAKKADMLLIRMENIAKTKGAKAASVLLYNQVLSLYSNDGHGQHAENLLRRMHKLYSSGDNVRAKPDSVTYNACLAAWTKSPERGSAKRADSILREMIALYKLDGDDKDDGVQPNTWSFNTVIAAWSRDEERPHHATDILNEMLRFSQKFKESDVRPDTISFSSAMYALSKSRRKGAIKEAEAILEQMEARCDAGDELMRPDAISYTTMITALANSGQENATERAIRLLQRMEERYKKTGDAGVKPDTVAFNAVLLAIANSKSHGCGQKASQLLRRMQDLSKAGNEDVTPNTVSYATVMLAWKNSGTLDAGDRAEKLLHRMQKEFAAGNEFVEPNTICFSTVISAFSNSKTQHGAERAEAVLEEMHRLYAAGHDKVEPNTVTYSSVVEAWVATGEGGAVDRAEAIIKEMEDMSDAGSDHLAPNTITYNVLIKGVERCRVGDKALRAQSILRRMHSRYEDSDEGQRRAKPNIRTYNAVFQACAATNNNEKDKRQAFTVLLAVLNEMRSISTTELRADKYTYPAVMKACANLFTGDIAPLDEAFQSCCEDGMVDLMVLSHVRRGAPKYLEKLIGIPARSVQIEHIPQGWKSRIGRMKWNGRRQ